MSLSLRKSIFFLIILFSFLEINAQFYSLGNDPARAKWRQIKTQNYTVIYPQEIDSLARTYVSLLENYRPAVLEPLLINPKPIPVVLHPYTTISNGMVTWAPKRMELFTSPSPYEGPYMPWDKNLVIHESRHVGQVSHFTKGIYNVLYYFIGEQATGLGLGLFVSTDFLEGDAVIAETELTSAGRGREANFLMYYRAAYLNNDLRTYEKYKFQSFKYFTPNRYAFGYLHNSAIRYQTSDYFWPGKSLDYIVKHWYNPDAGNKATKVYAGKSEREYFRFSQMLMTDIWEKDLETRGKFSSFTPISKKKERLFCDYRYPISSEDFIIGVKEGMEHSTTLIKIDQDGKEKKIRAFSPISSPLTLSPSGKIYWTETISREATSLEDFSVLKSYELKRNKTKTYHKDTKYFNPAVSSTGDTIAVIEYPIIGSSFLVLLEPEKGDQIFRVEAPQKGQLKEVTFLGNEIYCSAILENGIGIYKFSENQWTEVVPEQNQSIIGLKSYNDLLYFTSDLDGVLNIYTFQPTTKKLLRITNTKYGGSDPFIDIAKNQLFYSEFSLLGYKLAKVNLDSLDASPMDFFTPYKYPMAEMLSAQAKESSKVTVTNSIDGFDTEKYPSRKYSKFANLFRFHSWAPVYYNLDNIMSMSYDKYYDLASIGATAYSQNSLGTATTMLGYSYHNGFHSGHFKFAYTGFAPKIEISLDVNDRNSLHTDIQNNEIVSSPQIGTPYLKTNIKLYYPINLFGGGWQRGLIPQLNWRITNDTYYSYEKSKSTYDHHLYYGLRYYQVLPIPKSAIFPRWGFGVSAMGSSAPWTGENFGNSAYLYGYFYFPGIIRQQGIKLGVSWQYQFMEDKRYYLPSFTSLPRGYKQMFPTQNFFKATIDYAIPIYIGDITIPSFIHFRRLQFIPFVDYARDINAVGVEKQYYSFGADLLVDFHFLGFSVPLTAGVRYARTGAQARNRNSFEFLFSIDFP